MSDVMTVLVAAACLHVMRFCYSTFLPLACNKFIDVGT